MAAPRFQSLKERIAFEDLTYDRSVMPAESRSLVSKVQLEAVLEELRQARGLDLGDYRRATLERRLAVRMGNLGLKDFEQYLQRLRPDPLECNRLIETVVIKVSSFFRDPIVFELLAQRVLPAIMEHRRRDHTRQVQGWSASCATGEEAYPWPSSWQPEGRGLWAPLYLRNRCQSRGSGRGPNRQISPERLETTQLGVLDRFFRPTAEGFEVIPEIRRLVHFSRDDLIARNNLAPADSVFGSFDLVLCRNALIYFSLDLQQRDLDELYSALNPGGVLVLGMSESLPPAMESRLTAIDRPHRIFQKPVKGHLRLRRMEPQGVMTMNLLNRFTIKSRLWGASTLLLLLFLAFGLFALYKMRVLDQITWELYDYPFQVSNAALRTAIGVSNMQASLRQAILARSDSEAAVAV